MPWHILNRNSTTLTPTWCLHRDNLLGRLMRCPEPGKYARKQAEALLRNVGDGDHEAANRAGWWRGVECGWWWAAVIEFAVFAAVGE